MSNYYIIHADVLKSNISAQDKLVLAVIYSYTSQHLQCFVSDEKIYDSLNTKPTTTENKRRWAQRRLQSLEDQNLIKREYPKGRRVLRLVKPKPIEAYDLTKDALQKLYSKYGEGAVKKALKKAPKGSAKIRYNYIVKILSKPTW